MEDDSVNLNMVDEEEEAFQEDAAVVDQNLQLTWAWREFCPVRTRLDQSKIVLGWDISLRAVARWRFSSVSRWLREADEIESFLMKKERKFRGRNLGNLSDIGNNCMDDLVQFYPNHNFILLGSGQSVHNKGLTKWTNVANQAFNEAVDGHRPMELQVADENEPLHALEGKK
ncbi:hypothetical protein J1N35_027582 [Gossypium stocksii]|uniref:Uncharacterized protein n=1 Tax=Gossypium stocksii TaxID=47602 RepID=A0A9D3VA10_9ROSI|nr:hypothetical protein J1N35_027582 [Gossypium stocksii]